MSIDSLHLAQTAYWSLAISTSEECDPISVVVCYQSSEIHFDALLIEQ